MSSSHTKDMCGANPLHYDTTVVLKAYCRYQEGGSIKDLMRKLKLPEECIHDALYFRPLIYLRACSEYYRRFDETAAVTQESDGGRLNTFRAIYADFLCEVRSVVDLLGAGARNEQLSYFEFRFIKRRDWPIIRQSYGPKIKEIAGELDIPLRCTTTASDFDTRLWWDKYAAHTGSRSQKALTASSKTRVAIRSIALKNRLGNN